MQDPQNYVISPQLKSMLTARLKELESLMEVALAKVDTVTLLQLETEHQILATYWRVIDCATRDDSFLDRKNVQPILRPSTLSLLPENQRQWLIEHASSTTTN